MGVAIGLITALALPAVPAQAASGQPVVATGRCSAASTWELKLSPTSDGLIEVEFEVDQDLVGDTWGVALAQNGTVFYRNRRTTTGGGTFEVRVLTDDTPEVDRFRAGARNTRTGETCLGTASI